MFRRVADRQPDEANRLLRSAGLEPAFQKQEFSQSVEDGLITRQEPPAGRSVARGSQVKYWVSKGRPIVTVPNIVGKSLQDATNQLKELGLSIGERTQAFSDKDVGTVLDQDPNPGREVRSGDRVDVSISQGEERGIVPSVIGQDEADASAILANAGFRVNRVREPHPTAETGTVFDQDPAGEAEAPPGSVVDIFISEGPEQFGMPDVRGDPEADAVNELESRGLEVRVVRQFTADPSERGKVIDQNPSSGTTVSRGDTVEITVGTD